MGLFTNLFKKPEPLPPYTDAKLGTMQWSEDDEAWLGEYQQRKFSLAYEGESTPMRELITYAVEVLDDPAWLDATLGQAKQQALREFPKRYHEEIKSLVWGTIHFYRYEGIRRIIADLHGSKDDFAWRTEFRDRQCEGISFDR